MNTAPWPSQNLLPFVNPQANTPAELAQVFNTINLLIQQVNYLQKQRALAGGKGPQRFTGSNNSGYIDNNDLLNWPAAEFILGKTIGGTNYPQITVTPGTTGSEGTTVMAAAAGYLEIDAGALYLDTLHNYGVVVYPAGGNLVLGATGGNVTTASPLLAKTFQPTNIGGYYAYDGTQGHAGSVNPGGTMVFNDGLYISGAPPTGGSGGISYPVDTNYYCANSGGWAAMSTFFPGLTNVATQWTGSTYIVTVGTVTTGTWSAAISTSASVVVGAATTGVLSSTGMGIQPAADSTATFFIKNHAGSTGVFAVDTTNLQAIANKLLVQPATDTTTVFQVLNQAATCVLDVDTTNKRVGINNAAPAYALDVTGDINGTNNLTVPYGGFSGYVVTPLLIPYTNSTTAFQFVRNGTANAVMVLDTNNYRVGIGNTIGAPGFTLDVTGTLNVTSTSTFGASLTVSAGYLYAGVLVGTSGAPLPSIRSASGHDNAAGVIIESYTGGVVAATFDTASGGINVNKFISPYVDSSNGTTFGIWDEAGSNIVCGFDTTSHIVYPTHLVLPTS